MRVKCGNEACNFLSLYSPWIGNEKRGGGNNTEIPSDFISGFCKGLQRAKVVRAFFFTRTRGWRREIRDKSGFNFAKSQKQNFPNGIRHATIFWNERSIFSREKYCKKKKNRLKKVKPKGWRRNTRK